MKAIKNLSNKLFSIQAPGLFDFTLENKLTLYGQANQDINSMGVPKFSLTLIRLADYGEASRKDLKATFFAYALENCFKAEPAEQSEDRLRGKIFYRMTAITDTKFQGTHYKLLYLFFLLPLNDVYGIQLHGFTPLDLRDKYENSFGEIWRSLRWETDREAMEAAWASDHPETSGTGVVMAEAGRAEADLDTVPDACTDEGAISAANATGGDSTGFEYPVEPFQLPEDGSELFQIGDFTFGINQEKSAWSIGELSKELTATIVATVSDLERGLEARLLNDYAEVREVSLTVPAKGIYHKGLPAGSFDYLEDKNQPNYMYLRKEGFEYRLDFYGTITFEDGWLGINGYLKPPYENNPVFPVKIYKKFSADALDWKNYRFTSWEEAAQAPAELVHHLQITNPEFTTLPEGIYECKNLKSLVLANDQGRSKKLPLNHISERIGQLQALETISINNAGLSVLPESLGKLSALTNINFSGCDLSSLPAGVWKLPQLAYLILSGNQLPEIPADPELPGLHTLFIDNNQLKTLPRRLLEQKNIKKIKASGNPFDSLPQAYSDFKGLDLSLKEKKRLLDNEYKGAGGKGTINWDDAIFYARHEENLIKPVDALIEESGLGAHRQALRSLIKKAVGLDQTTEDDYRQTGNHRFGGRPDLPEAIDYPGFDDSGEKYQYEFIAQINCEQLAPLQDYLPRTGSLFFFLKSIHHFGQDSDPGKVIYVKDNSSLRSGKRFHFEEADFYELPEGEYTPYKAEAGIMNAAPFFYAWRQNQYLFQGDTASLLKEENLLDSEIYDAFEGPFSERWGAQHGVNVYGFTQHESPETQAALALKGDPGDWIILLKVSSAGDFQWGDAGDLFFVIHKSDLLKKDFSNVFITTESS